MTLKQHFNVVFINILPHNKTLCLTFFPSFYPPDVFHSSARDSQPKTIIRGQRSSDGSLDMTEINVSLVPRPSEVEALVGASPLRELLNYCTGISFEGFLPADSELCVEEGWCG